MSYSLILTRKFNLFKLEAFRSTSSCRNQLKTFKYTIKACLSFSINSIDYGSIFLSLIGNKGLAYLILSYLVHPQKKNV